MFSGLREHTVMTSDLDEIVLLIEEEFSPVASLELLGTDPDDTGYNVRSRQGGADVTEGYRRIDRIKKYLIRAAVVIGATAAALGAYKAYKNLPGTIASRVNADYDRIRRAHERVEHIAASIDGGKTFSSDTLRGHREAAKDVVKGSRAGMPENVVADSQELLNKIDALIKNTSARLKQDAKSKEEVAHQRQVISTLASLARVANSSGQRIGKTLKETPAST